MIFKYPAGQITNQLVAELVEQLAPEDIIVDSGNSNFHDSVANAQLAKEKEFILLIVVLLVASKERGKERV